MEHVGCSDQTEPSKIITTCDLLLDWLKAIHINPHKILGLNSFSLDDENLPSIAYSELKIFNKYFP